VRPAPRARRQQRSAGARETAGPAPHHRPARHPEIVKASLEVKLPKAASGGSTVGATLNLVLDKSGALAIDGQPRTLADAGRLVRAAVAADPKVQAVISADRTVDYGLVIELVDTVKLNGISTFALDVERVAPAASP
jgi:biopolymer transport protein ExbD